MKLPECVFMRSVLVCVEDESNYSMKSTLYLLVYEMKTFGKMHNIMK